MRDLFGLHRRRVRSALRDRIGSDTIEAVERDVVAGDYWVLTSREFLRLRQGVVAQHMNVGNIAGSVTEQPEGVTIRVHSRQPGEGQMLGTFRGQNDLTRRLAELLSPTAA